VLDLVLAGHGLRVVRDDVPSLPTATKRQVLKNIQKLRVFQKTRRFVFCPYPIGGYNQDIAKKRAYQQAARRSAMNTPLTLTSQIFTSTTPVLSVRAPTPPSPLLGGGKYEKNRKSPAASALALGHVFVGVG
jgi:hypothetical protein